MENHPNWRTHSLHHFSEGLGELNHQPVFRCFSQWKLLLYGGFPSLPCSLVPLDGLSFHCKMVINSECMTCKFGKARIWRIWTHSEVVDPAQFGQFGQFGRLISRKPTSTSVKRSSCRISGFRREDFEKSFLGSGDLKWIEAMRSFQF